MTAQHLGEDTVDRIADSSTTVAERKTPSRIKARAAPLIPRLSGWQPLYFSLSLICCVFAIF
jgi:hypothetical protein